MEFKLEPERFDEHQAIFIEEIIESVMTKLVEAGLEGEKLEEATAGIAFSIASIIDDTTPIESGGVEVKPYLTFRSGDDVAIHGGENAYTYAYVTGVLKKLFDV